MVTRAHMLRWTAVLLWMVLIFSFSAQNSQKSGNTSYSVTSTIKVVLEKIAPDIAEKIDVQKFDETVRTFAHFTIFFLLGLIVTWAVSLDRSGRILGVYAILICAAYSLFDEVHQHFVPGRAFQIVDLATDISGSAIAVWIFIKLSHIFFKKD